MRPWLHVIEPLFGYMAIAEKQILKNMFHTPKWNFGPNKNNIISVSKMIEIFKKSNP